MYNNKELDTAANIALINLYTRTKIDNKIELIGFNMNSCAHMALLNIAISLHTITGINIYVNTGFIDYLKLKFKIRKKCNIKFSTDRCVNITKENCDKIISDIEEKNNWHDIFNEIFMRYYK